MHLEALVLRLSLREAVGERLERLGPFVPGLSDCGEEERLQHPGTCAVEEIGAGDEHRVLRGRPGRKLVRPRKVHRWAVLHRADHTAVVLAVERAPRPEVVLDTLGPAVLVRPAAGLRLPPDAL